jgi:hypothetical protein
MPEPGLSARPRGAAKVRERVLTALAHAGDLRAEPAVDVRRRDELPVDLLVVEEAVLAVEEPGLQVEARPAELRLGDLADGNPLYRHPSTAARRFQSRHQLTRPSANGNLSDHPQWPIAICDVKSPKGMADNALVLAPNHMLRNIPTNPDKQIEEQEMSWTAFRPTIPVTEWCNITIMRSVR